MTINISNRNYGSKVIWNHFVIPCTFALRVDSKSEYFNFKSESSFSKSIYLTFKSSSWSCKSLFAIASSTHCFRDWSGILSKLVNSARQRVGPKINGHSHIDANFMFATKGFCSSSDVVKANLLGFIPSEILDNNFRHSLRMRWNPR